MGSRISKLTSFGWKPRSIDDRESESRTLGGAHVSASPTQDLGSKEGKSTQGSAQTSGQSSEKEKKRKFAKKGTKKATVEFLSRESLWKKSAKTPEAKMKSEEDPKRGSRSEEDLKRRSGTDEDLKRSKSDEEKKLAKTTERSVSSSTSDIDKRASKTGDSEGNKRTTRKVKARDKTRRPQSVEVYNKRLSKLDRGQKKYDAAMPRIFRKSRRFRKHAKTKSTLTSSLMFATISSSMGSFQFGYSIGCMNAPGKMITDWIMTSHKSMFDEDITRKQAEETLQTIVGLYGVGGAIGGLSSGILADTAGRRGCLLYTNIIAFLAAAFMGTAKYAGIYQMLQLGRFFIGVYVGITVVVPMYQVEIAPTNYRGFIGSFHQLLICASILFAQIMGHPLLFGTPEKWPLIFFFIAIPAIVQVITLPMIPESPRFTLCIRGEVEQAREDLELLRGSRDVVAEINSLRAEAAETWDLLRDRPTMCDMFRKEFRCPTLIVIIMMVFQQLTGINAVMFYSTMIFEEVGLSGEDAIFATIGVGTVNLLTTFIQMYFIDHPKSGRIQLLVIGTIGMIISTSFLTVAITFKEYTIAKYIAVGLVMIFVFSFALGPAAISWLLASELFLTNARANGNAYMSAANWTTSSLVGVVFPKINDRIHQYSFLRQGVEASEKLMPRSTGEAINICCYVKMLS
ncbi:Facilitated glucose transporter protein 1 [Trichostrongylus colubriformis]|uniref:Facilitated glucose transporter protein 1 n=1 Tax=Trichostrongylus colubriformis TaxID=6319 RepID=A0AAN8ILP6_TRICO